MDRAELGCSAGEYVAAMTRIRGRRVLPPIMREWARFCHVASRAGEAAGFGPGWPERRLSTAMAGVDGLPERLRRYLLEEE